MTAHNLLDVIATALQLNYLSDLQNASHESLCTAILTMDKTAYCLEEWDYALSYILDTSVKLNNLDEIVEILQQLEEI